MSPAPRAAVFLVLVLLGVLTVLFNAAPIRALEPTVRARGTAVVDGVLDDGEWEEAAEIETAIGLPAGLGGGAVDATFRLMNDDANLYVSLRFTLTGSLGMGDQLLAIVQAWRAAVTTCDATNTPDVHFAQLALGGAVHTDQHLVTYFEDACLVEGERGDEQDGGTTEGDATAIADDGEIVFEIAVPLDTPDDTHDLSASLHQRLTLSLVGGGCDEGSSCGSPAALSRSAYLVADGFLFFDDFETGDSTLWDLTQSPF